LKAYQEAMAEFRANPITYSLDEVEKELGLK
jgi:copG/DNA-binding domain protein